MDTYEFHPFADAFPMMTDREHAELVADIKANGLLEPIMFYQDKILDGRNRYKACRELGIRAMLHDFGGDDAEALAFVISKNLMRRQLTASQRAMVADNASQIRLKM
jgi:ParB-like chromosome segregation protein Spo0J